jgi:hypothetical protein
MHISRGFGGGIHAIGALVIYKYIYLNTHQLSVFPKFIHWVAFQEVQAFLF